MANSRMATCLWLSLRLERCLQRKRGGNAGGAAGAPAGAPGGVQAGGVMANPGAVPGAVPGMQMPGMPGMQQPMIRMQQPMMGMQQPMMGMQQPMMGMQQPMMGMQQPMMGMQQPMMGMQQPMMGMQQPMMGMQQPAGAMFGQQPMPAMQNPAAANQQHWLDWGERIQGAGLQMSFTKWKKGTATREQTVKLSQGNRLVTFHEVSVSAIYPAVLYVRDLRGAASGPLASDFIWFDANLNPDQLISCWSAAELRFPPEQAGVGVPS